MSGLIFKQISDDFRERTDHCDVGCHTNTYLVTYYREN